MDGLPSIPESRGVNHAKPTRNAERNVGKNTGNIEQHGHAGVGDAYHGSVPQAYHDSHPRIGIYGGTGRARFPEDGPTRASIMAKKVSLIIMWVTIACIAGILIQLTVSQIISRENIETSN